MKSKICSQRILHILILVGLVALQGAHAQVKGDGPLRWAYHKIWGDPLPQPVPQTNITVVVPENSKSAQNGDEMAKLEKMKWEAAQLEKKKAQDALRARYTARYNEVKRVDSILYQESMSKGLPFTFNYESVCVKDKCLKPEMKLKTEETACMRQLSDTIIAVLGIPEYRKVFEDKNITSVDFRLFDNRESARSDKMFSVGGNIKNVKGASARYQVNYWPEYNPNKYEDISKDEYKRLQAKPSLHTRIIPAQKDSGIFNVDGLLDSNGSCVDITDEIVAQLELLAHPEDADKINTSGSIKGGINDSFVSGSVTKETGGSKDTAKTAGKAASKAVK